MINNSCKNIDDYTARPDQTCSIQIFSGPERRKVLLAWYGLVALELDRPGLKYNFLVTPLSKVSLICFSPLLVQ